MALDYHLFLSTHVSPARAMERLVARVEGVEWSEDRLFLVDVDSSIRAVESESGSTIESAFHFTPTLTVSFRRARDADWDRFRRILLDASLILLEESQEALMLFNGERIEFQRLEGRLVFNLESGYWQDEDWLKERLGTAFERCLLPSPLL